MLLARNGQQVRLWDHDPEQVARLRQEGENRRFLPGIPLPEGITPQADLATALADCALLLLVVPSHAFAEVLQQVRPHLAAATPLAWASKGLHPGDGRLLSQVAADSLPGHDLLVLSGPTFAGEVARQLPTAVTLACSHAARAQQVADLFGADCFRPYTSLDLVGVQIGGAVKNVMAIGAGIADGLGFGANTRAALITRGLAEITRLGVALGGQAETFMGLAGLGDLVLTCTDNQSRNRRMGLALAAGQGIDQARAEIAQEVEGVGTAREVYQLAQRLGVDMPITEQVYQVLYSGLAPREAVIKLMGRRLKSEAV
ncbi:MAG: NAD(P)-dependent glycerol-3-phosphate dehydrogenase [Gammaproteobacteria bacterium SHHR-1]